MKKISLIAACIMIMLGSASVAFAQSTGYQYQSNGIFGCSQIGGASMSAGTFSAIGGIYVPVNDASVTLNSGILDYLNCILRPLVSELRQSATASFTKQGVVGFLTGRDGNPLFPVDLNADIVARSDEAALAQLQNLQGVNPAFQSQVRSAVARGYMADTRTQNQLVCNYNGDLKADITDPTNRPFSFENFQQLANPACNPLGAAMLVQDAVDQNVGNQVGQMLFKLQSANGVYGVEHTDAQGNHITDTPGALVGSNATQVEQSGFTQLENAQDIGQMIGAMYAGISTRVISDAQGLQGLAASSGGQPSYLDQVSSAAAGGVLNGTKNAAMQILSASRQNEANYLSAMNAIANSLTQTINQLRGMESTCWTLIAYKNDGQPQQHVCVAAPDASNKCTSTISATSTVTGIFGPLMEKVATSTAYSQPIINAQIVPLASTTITNIQVSQAALAQLDDLITTVNGAATQQQQNVALQKLDQLVAQGKLHTQYDAQNAAQQQSNVQNAMANLVQNTATTWGDSTDPNVGWCNVKNPPLISRWANQWKI